MPDLPDPGQEPWDQALNNYLLALEARLTAVDAKPEHIFNSFAWQFSGSSPPATGNQIRFDNPNPALTTMIDFRRIDSDGADRSAWFRLFDVGSYVRVADWDVSTVYHRFDVTGPANFVTADNVNVPVTWDQGSGMLPNAKVNVAFVVPLVL